MSELPPGDVPHLLVDDLEAPALDDAATHHWLRVRRLRDGAAITMTDGRGAWCPARIGRSGAVTPDGAVVRLPPPRPLTVCFSLTKGTKPEFVVQKLTEQGIDRIVPIVATRSVVRWDPDKAAANVERWRAVARGAVEQSMGVFLPRVDEVAPLAHAVELGARRLDRGGVGIDTTVDVVAVGPEGGWTDEESELLPFPVALGTTVLRAETAAITVGGLMTALRAGFV